MSKFNKKSSVESKNMEHPQAEMNYEGGLNFSVSPQLELYLKTASCLVGETKFYESADESFNSLLDSINKVLDVEPEFVLQLAKFARSKLYLRSVPLVLLSEFANSKAVGSVEHSRDYVASTIQRADEITELIAYQLMRNKEHPRKSKLPQMIKFGVAKAFNNFDGYQFAKYNRAGEVKLRDALFLTHPKAKNDEQQKLFDQIATDTLPMPETWETMRSTGKMNWHEVIHNVWNKDGKIHNYMAILRNLRNCLTSEDVTNEDIQLVASMLRNKEAVHRSKQYPFRFLSAYFTVHGNKTRSFYDFNEAKGIEHPMSNTVLSALEEAILYSADNIPRLNGTTLIACDVSSSMETPISRGSLIHNYEIGLVLGMLVNRYCDNSITGFFGDSWKQIPLAQTSGVLQNTIELHSREGEVGYSTNGYKIIEWLLDKNIAVDRIMIFTDEQMWDSYGCGKHFADVFTKYQRLYPEVKLYNFDLAGYGSLVMPENARNVCNIGGWSDKIFDFIKTYEADNTGVIEEIRAVKP